MLHDIWIYAGSFVGYWFDGYWVLTTLPEIAVKSAEWFPEWAASISTWLDRWLLTAEGRRRLSAALFVIGILAAGFLAWDDQYQLANTVSRPAAQTQIDEAVRDQIAPLQREIDSQRVQLAAFQTTVANLAHKQAAVIKPVNSIAILKKQTLELSSKLLNTSTEAISLMAAHPLRMNPPSGSAWAVIEQQSIQRAESMQAQGRLEATTLFSNYKNEYATKVIMLRQQFINLGQTNWRSVQYYANPANIHDIQVIGFELFQHANLLKPGNGEPN
ncbi:MAG TPA: hypothetical protein VMF50_08590 [Candidatus Binataceae bacterium]|nr:hypothetical protein [Candidatus Binataceae bacterium]